MVADEDAKERLHQGWHCFAVDRPVLILLIAGRRRCHGNQQTIKVVENTEVSPGVTRTEDAGMVDKVAKFSETRWPRGGADQFVSLLPQVNRYSSSDITAPHNSEPLRHSASSHFT